MPSFQHGDATIHFDDEGDPSGSPVLLIAPGGMRSFNDKWNEMPWNPRVQLADQPLRVIGMDQRNAGRSRGPVSAVSGWDQYRDDQLALLDHLGIERCSVIGMCIGGPYIANLLKSAPDRFSSAVMLQPVGVYDDNRPEFYAIFERWMGEIGDEHPEATEGDWNSFCSNMWDGEFLLNMTEDDVAAVTVPLLVAMGNDVYHPQQTSRRITELAPDVTFLEEWKDDESLPATDRSIKEFLRSTTPG